MRFDVVIIGGGLAGFTAGLRLLEAGKSCALVSMGQSALHFSSGSFDFLNRLPDGTRIERPLEALSELAHQAPEHPYSLLGAEKTAELALDAERYLKKWGLAMTGSLKAGNHRRISPLGKLVPTWLSSPDTLTVQDCLDGPPAACPWEKAVLVNIDGFLDCYPEILAANLAVLGLPVEYRSFTIPALEILRENPSEFRSINVARVLDRPENFTQLTGALVKAAGDADTVLLPACIGWRDSEQITKIGNHIRKQIHLIPTLPPSLIGGRINRFLSRVFLARGGVLMSGDKAVGYELAQDSRSPVRISKLYTANHEDVPLEAGAYLLASGSFFSKGLLADQQEVMEPVFHLDMVDIPAQREQWTAAGVFEAQPYAHFGVKTNDAMQGYLGGVPVSNLHVAGMIIGNYDAVHMGCGAGVALVTGLAAAGAILKGQG